jgi:hypothetical protein
MTVTYRKLPQFAISMEIAEAIDADVKQAIEVQTVVL